MCEVKPSNIPGAGCGLFAVKHFKAGDIITNYGGSFFIDRNSEYLLLDEYGITWDAKHDYDEKTELGRFANDADFKPENFNYKFSNNCEFVTCEAMGISPKLIATRDIEIGEEIFVPYGKKYWNFWELRK